MLGKSIKRDGFDNLHLRIRTLGYPENGESMMISLIDGDDELCNIFIDNYEVDGYQHWISTLPEKTRIDAFIWTHPDEDHSLGIDSLLEKFDPENEAEIFVPTSLTKQLLIDNKKTKALTGYDYLKKNYNKGRKYQWNEISLSEGEGIRNLFSRKIINRKNNNHVNFRVGFMLPISAVVNRRVDKKSMNQGAMNDLSIFAVVELNSVRYIFAGDLHKMNIRFLDDEYLANCRFVKIPHHGAKDTIKLVDKIQPLESQETHSVTTIFGSSHPYNNVLKKYNSKFSNVYSTDRGKNKFGLVEIDYNIKDLSKFEVRLEGNARHVNV